MRKITIQCDNTDCNFTAVTTSPLRFGDAGVCCPECGEVLINRSDVISYKVLGVLAALRLVKLVDEATPKSHEFNSRKGFRR